MVKKDITNEGSVCPSVDWFLTRGKSGKKQGMRASRAANWQQPHLDKEGSAKLAQYLIEQSTI